MDFLFWGYIKDIVPEDGINAPSVGMQNVILTIPGEIMGDTWAEIEYCLLLSIIEYRWKFINHK